VDTQYGPVHVKLKWVDGVFAGLKPEYEDCLALAEQANVPVRVVHAAAMTAGMERYGDERYDS
jgi:uncharacterized protein (DUF111 family)